jgi:AcrR family transcriptional regulator
MRDIAKAANISRATLYTYFGNKDQVFDAAVDGIIFTATERSRRALATVGEKASLQDKLFFSVWRAADGLHRHFCSPKIKFLSRNMDA